VLIFAGLAAALDRDRLVPSGSTGQELDQESASRLEETVRTFNAILQDFFATGGNPALIDEMPATRSVKHYLFRDLGYLQRAGLVLVYDLASLRVIESVRSGHDQAEVLVYEEWNYLYQRAEDRRPISELRGTGLGIRYHLARQGDRWVVTRWDPEPVPEERLVDPGGGSR
jgi:hypothetical protein